MDHLETRREGDDPQYFLNGRLVEAGQELEVFTLWGWRRGSFVPGDPPHIRTMHGEDIFIETTDQVRWPEGQE